MTLLLPHVAKERKERVKEHSDMSDSSDRDYLVNFCVSSPEECLRNECLRVVASTFSQDLYISHALRQERGGGEGEGEMNMSVCHRRSRRASIRH